MNKSKSAVASSVAPKRSAVAQAIRQHLTLPRACALAAMTITTPAFAQSFPASIELSDLDGTDGFVLNSIEEGDGTGVSVSDAGDINGDGVDDVIIGAPDASPNNIILSGQSFVVFGGGAVGVGGVIELADLDGSNGFVLNGVNDGSLSGLNVSEAGDINGDGVDDLIIGTGFDNISGYNYRTDDLSVRSYVVFGGSDVGLGGVIELSDLDGSNGFELGRSDSESFYDIAVGAAGDINGDGIDDLIIGEYGADPNGPFTGASYVVFGGAGVGDTGMVELSTLDGSDGFVLNGIDSLFNFSGGSVSGAGDINDDGSDDLIIGTYGAYNSESYVVFGGGGVGAGGVIELSDLDGSNGFVLNNGIEFTDDSVIRAGDINDDGVDDLIIGAPFVDTNGRSSGASYVVFGSSELGVDGVIELADLNGSNGFVLNGVDESDLSGSSVSGAGDINGDGVDDVIIGALGADPNGESYVVFGGVGVGVSGVIELSTLNGSNGFVLNGVDEFDFSGNSVSGAGDINGDGVDDLIIGATRTDPNGFSSGENYVVFGRATTSTPTPTPTLTCNGLAVTVNLALRQNTTDRDDVILGTEGADFIRALGGNDTICGLGGDDVINAGGGADWVDAGAGDDRVFGIGGADVLRGSSGADRIFGGGGDDLINGDGGADRLDGGFGDDLIFGGGGQDEVFGRDGSDTLFGGDGNDSVLGGDGADEVNGGAGADSLNGGSGNDNCIVDSTDSISRCN